MSSPVRELTERKGRRKDHEHGDLPDGRPCPDQTYLTGPDRTKATGRLTLPRQTAWNGEEKRERQEAKRESRRLNSG